MVSMPKFAEKTTTVSRKSYAIRFVPVVSREGADATTGGGISYHGSRWRPDGA